jgi:arabinan endo-1,5-alpha-L-arabinosidase
MLTVRHFQSPSDLRLRAFVAATIGALLAASGFFAASLTAPAAIAAGETYRNPLEPTSPVGIVESCADPSVIRGQEPEDDHLWYMYCTTDPLNDDDRDANGNFVFRLIPTFSSSDLVNWEYEGDAFATRPDWVGDTAGLWAPEIAYFNGQYYLYYAAQFTDGGSSAIGVATSDSPLGPWTDSGDPVVDPLPDGRWAFDPEVNQDTDGTRYLFFGSYFGGIKSRALTADGLETLPGTQTDITIDNRYEGAEVAFHDGWYYLFASATNCCNGPLTGYGVFVGRSESLLGPYVDAEGVSLLAENVGGTPVIYQNGNRWVGTGHNTVFVDEAGQWWTIYHAADVNDPFFEGTTDFTKRPALLDAIDWIDGWPTLNGGAGPSDTPQHAPAAQPGDTTNHKARMAKADVVGKTIWADEFDDGTLNGWEWVREPAEDTYAETGGLFSMDTQPADLFVDSNNASVLLADAPSGNYVVETKVRLDPPPTGCCFNYVQAGLVVYGDDDNFIKLVNVSIWNTRQTEFAKELAPVPDGYPRYGNMVVGPSGEWTWLRIVHRTSGAGVGGTETYTAYTSQNGVDWSRGGTWTHTLGEDASIGLVAMGGSGFEAEFEYVRVSKVHR